MKRQTSHKPALQIMLELAQSVIGHCMVGAGTIIGSFFPKTTEELGLPSLYQQEETSPNGWITDGNAIRSYWICVGSDLRHAMTKMAEDRLSSPPIHHG